MNRDKKIHKAAIFPYDDEFSPFYKYKGLLQDMEIVKVLSFQGWGTVGRKALKCGETENKDELWIEDALTVLDTNEFEILWVIDTEHSVEDEYLFQVIEKMAESGKTICISRKLDNSQKNKIKRICDIKKVKLYYRPEEESADDFSDEMDVLYNLNTPVIAVCGIGEKTNKNELQLDIKSRLQREGYHVCWISTRRESVFFGGEQFPQFMFDSGLSEKKKIIMYNHFLKWIEQEKKPELFLLGVPGGIMPSSKKQVDYFGITAFEVFNAVMPDFVVMSLYFREMGNKYLQQLENVMKYKFNIEIDCFNMSDTEQDIYSLDKLAPVEYLFYDDKTISKKADEIIYDNIPVFSRSTYEKLYEFIIWKLNGYDDLKVL